MRANCGAVILAGTLALTLTPGMGTTSARAQWPSTTPAPRTTGAVLRDPTTLRASTPTANSYWGAKPTTPAPTNTKPSAWQRFKSRFTRTGSGGQSEGTPIYRDPTTGRDNLPLSKPWMEPAR
jgi:hypothetical protein